MAKFICLCICIFKDEDAWIAYGLGKPEKRYLRCRGKTSYILRHRSSELKIIKGSISLGRRTGASTTETEVRKEERDDNNSAL